jgi:anaerobic selenocysteine-containing dehydrogenase
MSKVSPKLNESIKKVFGFDPPEKEGLDTVHAVKAMHEGRVKVFISLGGNFAAAASDTHYTAEAISKCKLTVSISTKMNRTHLIPGKTSIILPTLGRSEKDIRNGRERMVTVENSVGKVHASRGHLKPASEHLMSETYIVAHLAHVTIGHRYGVDWLALGSNYDEIRQKIAEVISGFDQYTKRVQNEDGFYLPNNVRNKDFSNLPGEKAQFSICPLPDHRLEEDQFLLTTIRSHDQFNTTIYGLDDRYRGIYNERRVIFVNPEDMEKHQLARLQLVDLESHYDGVKRVARNFHIVPYNIPRQNLAGYFPEMNPLVPNNHFADGSHTPISKSVKVKIVPVKHSPILEK